MRRVFRYVSWLLSLTRIAAMRTASSRSTVSKVKVRMRQAILFLRSSTTISQASLTPSSVFFSFSAAIFSCRSLFSKLLDFSSSPESRLITESFLLARESAVFLKLARSLVRSPMRLYLVSSSTSSCSYSSTNSQLASLSMNSYKCRTKTSRPSKSSLASCCGLRLARPSCSARRRSSRRARPSKASSKLCEVQPVAWPFLRPSTFLRGMSFLRKKTQRRPSTMEGMSCTRILAQTSLPARLSVKPLRCSRLKASPLMKARMRWLWLARISGTRKSSMRAGRPKSRRMARLKAALQPASSPNCSSPTATKHIGVSLPRLNACMFSEIRSTRSSPRPAALSNLGVSITWKGERAGMLSTFAQQSLVMAQRISADFSKLLEMSLYIWRILECHCSSVCTHLAIFCPSGSRLPISSQRAAVALAVLRRSLRYFSKAVWKFMKASALRLTTPSAWYLMAMLSCRQQLITLRFCRKDRKLRPRVSSRWRQLLTMQQASLTRPSLNRCTSARSITMYWYFSTRRRISLSASSSISARLYACPMQSIRKRYQTTSSYSPSTLPLEEMCAMTEEQAHSGLLQRRWCRMMKYSSFSKYSLMLLIRNTRIFIWCTVGLGSQRILRTLNWETQSMRQTKETMPTSCSRMDCCAPPWMAWQRRMRQVKATALIMPLSGRSWLQAKMGCLMLMARKTTKKSVATAIRAGWLIGARMAKGTLKMLSSRQMLMQVSFLLSCGVRMKVLEVLYSDSGRRKARQMLSATMPAAFEPALPSPCATTMVARISGASTEVLLSICRWSRMLPMYILSVLGLTSISSGSVMSSLTTMSREKTTMMRRQSTMEKAGSRQVLGSAHCTILNSTDSGSATQAMVWRSMMRCVMRQNFSCACPSMMMWQTVLISVLAKRVISSRFFKFQKVKLHPT